MNGEDEATFPIDALSSRATLMAEVVRLRAALTEAEQRNERLRQDIANLPAAEGFVKADDIIRLLYRDEWKPLTVPSTKETTDERGER